jgi:L-asparagine oxygenase
MNDLITEVQVQVLGDGARLREDTLEGFSEEPGLLDRHVVLLSGGPTEGARPTPDAYEKGSEGHPSDDFAFDVAVSLGGQVAGYRGERTGALLQSVVPLASDAQLPINSGSRVQFSLHTENAHHPYPPTVLALHCLRDDPSCLTILADCEAGFATLSAEHRALLTSRDFLTAPGASFRRSNTAASSSPHAIKGQRFGRTSFKFNAHNTVGLGGAAQAAFDAFLAAIRDCAVHVCLAEGQTALINNLVVAHGRSAFEPRFDGSDRWLRRFYIVPPTAPGVAHPDRAAARLL